MPSSQWLGLLLVLLTLHPSYNFEHQRGHLPGYLEAEVVAFWDQRAWKSLAIVLSDASPLLLNLSRKLRRNGGSRLIRTMLADAVNLVPRNNDYLQVEFVTVLVGYGSQMETVIDLLKRSSGYSALVICHDISVVNALTDIPLGYFYLEFSRRTPVILKMISSRNEMGAFSHVSSTIGSLSDMGGAHMMAITMSYPPFLTLGKCYGKRPCQGSYGHSYDLLDFVAKSQNFTFSVHMEPTGIWGDAPNEVRQISSTNISSKGTFKKTICGLNDMPLSGWQPNVRRISWVDFSFAYADDSYHCFAKKEDLDKGGNTVLFKPLSYSAWIAGCLMIILILAGHITFFRSSGPEHSRIIWTSTSGIAWTLVFAYYSGVQTMFLTSESLPPFSSVIEALNKRHDWTFLMVDNEEFYYLNNFPKIHNDETYKRALQLLNTFTEKSYSQDEGLKILFQEKKVCMISTMARMRRGVRGRNVPALTAFCDPDRVWYSFMFPKNSPFKLAINEGLNSLRQKGLGASLARRWRIGGEWGEASSGHSEPSHLLEERSLSLAQVSPAFLGGAAVMALCLIIVVLELGAKKGIFKARMQMFEMTY